MAELEAKIWTRNASAYLEALSERWRMQYPVRFDALTAEIELPDALLVLTADESKLTVRLAYLKQDDVDRTRLSVEEHLNAAAAAPLTFSWQTGLNETKSA